MDFCTKSPQTVKQRDIQMTNEVKITRAEQKARRPKQILDAAFEEFVERGYVATRVEDIAERVGVTKGTIYVYFETKEELFSAMINHISTPFEDILTSGRKLEGNCENRLRTLIGSSTTIFSGAGGCGNSCAL